MTTTMILVTGGAFLIGVALGLRHTKIGGLYLLSMLILAFAAFDYAVDRIVVWPYKYWLIVDLIAVQMGYLVGAVLAILAPSKKNHKRRDSE